MYLAALTVFILLHCPSEVGAATAVEDLDVLPMMLKMMASLGMVIGLFLLMYALVQKSRAWLPGSGAQQLINIISVRHIGPKRTLYLVEVDSRRFFLAATAEQVRLLSEWNVSEWPSRCDDKPCDERFAACMDELGSNPGSQMESVERGE